MTHSYPHPSNPNPNRDPNLPWVVERPLPWLMSSMSSSQRNRSFSPVSRSVSTSWVGVGLGLGGLG